MWRLLFFACVVFSHSTTFLEFQDVIGNVPSCIDKNNVTRALGETWQLNDECVSSRCLTVNATKSLIMHYKCPKVETDVNGCKVVQDLQLAHPKCCPQIVC